MFSEYASRFLAQSQSRLSLGQSDAHESRNTLDRRRGGPSRTSSRSYLQRRPLGHPYQPGGPTASRFPFASRFAQAAPPAPLFYSATDEFREEDDSEEHEREVADFYALQRSRRDFGAGRALTESSELEDEEEEQISSGRGRNTKAGKQPKFAKRTGGIRSSWIENKSDARPKDNDAYQDFSTKENTEDESEASISTGLDKGKLMSVELASTVQGSVDVVNAEDGLDDNPPSVQRFQKHPNTQARAGFIPLDSEQEPGTTRPRLPSPNTESAPPTVILPPPEPMRHDTFWSSIYLICLASLFASFVLICLHTSAPSSAIGDTIYTTLHSSFYLLAVDTLVAVIVALVWLATLRSFVRPLVLGILVAVPVILFSFSLYPFISSFKGSWNGDGFQDKVMRWFSFLPAVAAVFWTYTVYKGRNALGRAIELLEFACRILAASPALIIFGFIVLAGVVVWTWVWMLMFTRIFLGGDYSQSKRLFIIDTSTWWLGIFFVLIYLWTLGVLSAIQRATTAATVSQWYFHRLAIPAPSSQRVVRASFSHATTTIFGTICLATLLALAVRLPLLILPRRVSGFIFLCFYSLIPTSIATLTNPLTITYAAIHSQPLAVSAHALSEMSFISRTSPTTTLTPQTFSSKNSPLSRSSTPSLLAYRLAKLLLHAARFMASLAFGFGGWVSTARMLRLVGSTMRGSAYAYVVGLIAAAIGWAVLGAMEGVLAGILDAVVVCWGSEVGSQGLGQTRYCREAGELLRDEGEVEL